MIAERRSAASELLERARERGLDADQVQALIDDAPPGWLEDGLSPADAELALLCAPIRPGELRVRVESVDDGQDAGAAAPWALTVVASDRPGLLALSTATMARNNLTILSARALCFSALGIALQRLVVRSERPEPTGEPEWAYIGQQLRAAYADELVPSFSAHPVAAAAVRVRHDDEGRMILTLDATDTLGLLASMTGWLSKQGFTIDAADVRTEGGRALDELTVRPTKTSPPEVDTHALLAHLGVR